MSHQGAFLGIDVLSQAGIQIEGGLTSKRGNRKKAGRGGCEEGTVVRRNFVVVARKQGPGVLPPLCCAGFQHGSAMF